MIYIFNFYIRNTRLPVGPARFKNGWLATKEFARKCERTFEYLSPQVELGTTQFATRPSLPMNNSRFYPPLNNLRQNLNPNNLTNYNTIAVWYNLVWFTILIQLQVPNRHVTFLMFSRTHLFFISENTNFDSILIQLKKKCLLLNGQSIYMWSRRFGIRPLLSAGISWGVLDCAHLSLLPHWGE